MLKKGGNIQKRKEEKHMKKNTKKKLKDIRSAIVMMCVMVAMMSTASYAWFSMTSTPTVTGMQMTAASTGGLKISWVNDATKFKNVITYADVENTAQDKGTAKRLVPVHPTGVATFAEGQYEGNTVTGLKSNLTDLTDYVAHYTVFLKSDYAETKSVGIVCGNATSEGDLGASNDQPKILGSLVRAKTGGVGDTSSMQAPYAVRVGFVADPAQMVIWEPNNNGKNENGTYAVDEVEKVLQATISSMEDGTITTGGTNTISNALFTIDSGATKKVDIYIWLEGTDVDCVDEIKTDYLEAQVQFTVVE